MTEREMTLAEAIENIKGQDPVDIDWRPAVFIGSVDFDCALAIATILNAVVKGELK